MDFTYSEEQSMMRDSARGFLRKMCPDVEWHLRMDKDERGYTDELWQGMTDLGWLGIALPDEYGGIGGDFLDLVVLLEEMGYRAVPGPFFSTVILGIYTLLAAGSEDQKRELLPKVADGKIAMTLALTEPGTTRFDPYYIETTADDTGDTYTINGTKLFVPDANVADYLLVAARTSGQSASSRGITLFLVPADTAGIEISSLKTVGGDKQCEVTFQNVRVPKESVVGAVDEAAEVIARVLQKAAVGKAAEMLGASKRVLEITTAYAQDRVQFGKPIGAFQAVQHHCADMKMMVEQSIFITYKAAWMISNDMDEAGTFASIAKASVSDACKRIMSIGHQILGGTGFMVEHEMPIYSRRAKGAEYAFGGPIYHRELVARNVGL